MSESKELLEATIKGLKERVNQLNNDLAIKEKELDDVNKPELNQSTLDVIYDCVTEGIEEYDFSDSDNYEFEPELDYEGKVVIGSIEINNKDYIREPIIKFIEKTFNIIDDTEENSAQ